MNGRLRILFKREAWDDKVSMLIAERDEQGTIVAVAERVVMRRLGPEDEMQPLEATLRVWSHGAAEEMLQALMDDLWALGYRPADVGTAGHLAATQAHLADMRAIVGKKLGVKFGEGK